MSHEAFFVRHMSGTGCGKVPRHACLLHPRAVGTNEEEEEKGKTSEVASLTRAVHVGPQQRLLLSKIFFSFQRQIYRKKQKKRQRIFHLLVPSPNGRNGQS